MRVRCLVFIAALALAPQAGLADSPSAGEVAAEASAEFVQPSVTQHEIRIDGETFAFEARAEMLELTDDAGRSTAHLFTVSYHATDQDGDRPVTFLMNGGPGAASAYLHVGGVGPWVIATDPLGRPTQNGELRENPHSWLAHTDLVFVDPVGTGFSRPADPDDDGFYERDADLESLADLIELWLDTRDRRASPVYLAGESYGGYRAAALPKRLLHDRGISVAGAILVSPVIDFSTIRHQPPRPLSWALLLPSYAATAAGHGRAEEVDAGELRRFALEDYLLALIHPERMAALVPRLAELTGLDENLLRERRGRVFPSDFRHQLLADENRVVSAYDALIAYPHPEPSRGSSRVDPVLDGMTPAFVTGLMAHLRERLGWAHGRDYRLLNRQVNRVWRYGSPRAQGYVSSMRLLQEVMAVHEDFRVFAAHGEADLVTPWLATEWLFGQLRDGLGGTQGRLVFERYPGGHMFYMRPDASQKLGKDIGEFLGTR